MLLAAWLPELRLLLPSPSPAVRSVRLSSTLESGQGSPGSLAVLYMELCARMSLALQPVALEGGR